MANDSELTYEKAFPSRFLKAALFEGKQVTLTIETAFMETLEGEKGPESKLILGFVGKPMQLVCNKTNAKCLTEMFGNKVSTWVGKRVTWYPTKARLGPKEVDCIRVYGSPDIPEDVEIAARIGRKTFKTTLHAIKTTKAKPETSVDPRIMAGWEFMGWTKDEGHADFSKSGMDAGAYLTHLNVEIDKRNAEEVA